ncbi:MAG: [Fe-S]-binding protein [Pseudomonadota bacterium]
MKLYRLMRKPPFFMRASHYMKKDDRPVKSGEKARHAVIIPLVLMQFGSLKDKLAAMGTTKAALVTSIKEMIKSARGLETNPKIGKKTIEKGVLDELEAYAFALGVSQIGYTKVNPDFIFKDFEILYDNAMVITMEMEQEAMKTAPSDAATGEVWRTYSDLGIIVNKLAHFLRERGINCHPSPAVGGDVCTPPLAQDAGVGVIGKNGLLITPEFGPSQRIAVVFIDADNLPLQTLTDNTHLWIKDFCETCNNCIRQCPGQAIYEQTQTLEDGYPVYIEREKCAPYFSKNCCTCIATCPFIHGNYDKIKANYEGRLRLKMVHEIQD